MLRIFKQSYPLEFSFLFNNEKWKMENDEWKMSFFCCYRLPLPNLQIYSA